MDSILLDVCRRAGVVMETGVALPCKLPMRLGSGPEGLRRCTATALSTCEVREVGTGRMIGVPGAAPCGTCASSRALSTCKAPEVGTGRMTGRLAVSPCGIRASLAVLVTCNTAEVGIGRAGDALVTAS